MTVFEKSRSENIIYHRTIHNFVYFIQFCLHKYRKESTSGIFWNNAAETWIDIYSNSDNKLVERIINFVSGAEKKPQVDAHFMSESGIIDVFFLLGPEPMDTFKQYAALTGTHNLPPVSNILIFYF